MKQEDNEDGDEKLVTSLQMKESKVKKEDGRKKKIKWKGRRNHEMKGPDSSPLYNQK